MLRWFEKKPYRKIGFEDVKYAIDHGGNYLLINTLPASEQGCLIKTTVDFTAEEAALNELINRFTLTSKTIVVYGKHTMDMTVEKKYDQLVGLGFSDVVMYCGGLFEWMLLQDVYGCVEFPTTGREVDILKFRPTKTFGVARIAN